MKRSIIIISLMVFCWTPQVFSGEEISETADSQWHLALKDLNERAKSNLKDFTAELGRNYGVSEETINKLLNKVGMAPADAYMAAKVSKVAERPMEDVVKEYESNKNKGWGVIAKNLGIKPGSKEFHDLKRDDSGMLTKSKKKGGKGGKGKEKKSKGKKGKKKMVLCNLNDGIHDQWNTDNL